MRGQKIFKKAVKVLSLLFYIVSTFSLDLQSFNHH